METCLCSTINRLAGAFNESEARSLSLELNKHLSSIRTMLDQSKTLAHDVRYRIVPIDQRTAKILSIQHLDNTRVSRICEKVKDAIDHFWTPSDDVDHDKLRRRLACVMIYLRSKMNNHDLVPPAISSLVQGMKISELRYAGRKYIKVARRLGSIGSMIWLPLDVPASTYERYLNMDDEIVFAHLRSISVHLPDYTDFVQRIVADQLNDPSSPLPYYNLAPEYGDMIQSSDQLLLLIHALGGLDIPIKLLESVRLTKRRWTAGGELEEVTATDFGVSYNLVCLLSDDINLSRLAARPDVKVHSLEDGTPAFSICPEDRSALSNGLTSQTQEYFLSIAIRLVAFATPPPLEGNTSWSIPLKEATWALLNKVTEQKRVAALLKTHVMESLFYFAERDSFTIRRIAIDRARSLLTKSMPYYFHACVALFESILRRLEGKLVNSTSTVQDFLSTSPPPTTRLENALQGRLHISLMETKIQHYDSGIAACIYAWEGIQPLSSLETEVTRRLQGTASRFFQSIGDFSTARASLEQHLWLDSARPIRRNTRLLLVGRLAEVYCELCQYQKAIELLQPEFNSIPQAERKGRPYRRLLLASVEASLGKEDLNAAESTLQRLVDTEPPALDDTNDQVLYMRRVIAKARTAHMKQNYKDASGLWRAALQNMEQLQIFRSKHPWTSALIQLSMAHAQLSIGDEGSGKQSWAKALEISRIERCEYIIPVVANIWARKIVSEIHRTYGWPFLMMLPGGNPDVVWS